MRANDSDPLGWTSMRRALDPNRPGVALLLYAALGGIACFWRQGVVGLVQMEGMVADGARSMIATGDWVVPRVYGEIYTYKPALAYWLASLALRVADPPPEWLLRLPSALSAFLMGLAVFFLVKKLAGPRTAFFCSIASVSAGLFLQKVRVAEFDVPLAAGVGVAVVATCANLASNRARFSLWILAYAGLAFAFLAKGIPALMCFVPGLLAAGWWTGRRGRLLNWRHLVPVLGCGAIMAFYLHLAYDSAGSVAFEQPLLEARIRGFGWDLRQVGDVLAVLGQESSQGAGITEMPAVAALRSATKPALILIAFLPWSLVTLFAWAGPGARDSATESERLLVAARAFLLAGVLTFALVPTHEMRYYLPLCVPVGLVAGLVLARFKSGNPLRGLQPAAIGVASLAAIVALLAGVAYDTPGVPGANRAVLILAGSLILASIWHPRGLARRRAVGAALVLAAFAFLAAESLAGQLHRGFRRDLSRQAEQLRRWVPESEPIWILGPADLAGKSSSLYFYLNRSVRTFRPGRRFPPAGSFCVLSSDRPLVVGETSRFEFAELARARDPWRSYLLGRCQGHLGSGSRRAVSVR